MIEINFFILDINILAFCRFSKYYRSQQLANEGYILAFCRFSKYYRSQQLANEGCVKSSPVSWRATDLLGQ